MDDRLRESVSALMDDEANELEVQRVLSVMEEDSEELKSVWSSYHSIREVVKDDVGQKFSIDISAGVAAAIRDEEILPEAVELENASQKTILEQRTLASANELDKKVEAHTSFKPWFAIAASLVLAVIFSLQANFDSDVGVPELAVNDQNHSGNIVKVRSALPGQELDVDSPVIISQLDEAQAKQLSRYLLRHAEHTVRGTQSGFVPLARVASVNSVGI